MRFDQLTEHYLKQKSQLDAATGCWNWLGGVQSNGYGQISIKRQRILAHRASWLVFHGVFDPTLFVCHKCDNPRCINPSHLFLGSNKDNMQDAKRKGRLAIQKDKSFTKLPRCRKLGFSAVEFIRDSDAPLKELAERFKVSMATISMVRRGLRKKI